MARIIFGWELGGGLGHVGPFMPIAKRLVEMGHEVCLVVRDLSRTATRFEGLNCRLFQAPIKVHTIPDAIARPVTLPQVLHNVGLGSSGLLQTRLLAWRELFSVIRPDLILLDHAPTAMIAARGLSVPVAQIGTGFTCPRPSTPMANLFPWLPHVPDELARQENRMLASINEAVKKIGAAPLDSMAELYRSPDGTFLTTFAELDPYGRRERADYLGVWSFNEPGFQTREVTWPPGDGPKIFAYLKPSTGLGHLFQWIAGQRLPLLVVGDGLDVAALRKVGHSTVQIADGPLDLEAVRQLADLAILNGTHGATASMLLEGLPLLQIPHNLEQRLTTIRTSELGVALEAEKDQPRQLIAQLGSLISEVRFREAAQEFAAKYRDFRPEVSIEHVVNRLCQLVG